MKLKRIGIIALTVLSMLCANAYAAGLNVCTHMSPDRMYPVETSVGNLRVLNSEWVRDEILWRIIDWGGNGNYRLPDEEWITWVDKAIENGIKPLCILGAGNGFYQESDEYTTQHMPTYGTKSGAAKAKEDLYWSRWIGYVEFVATTFKGKIKAYQVWNEPNNDGFWTASANPPSGVTPENYAKLYIATRNAIKAIDPDAIVICGSVTGASSDAIKFTNDTLSYIKNNGGLSQIDAYSIHMYSKSPEGSYLDGLNAVYNNAFLKQGYTGPVWMTENGWSAVDDVSVEEQASLAIRFPIMYESFLKSHNTTGKNFWYDLKNDGADASEKEHNFGLMYNDDTPKPAYNAVKIFNKLTNGMTFQSLKSNSDKYVAEYSDGNNNYTYVAWTTKSSAQTVTVDIKGEVTTVYSMDGNVIDEFEETGNKSFTVTSEPTLIHSVEGRPTFSDSTVISYNSETREISVSGEIKRLKSENEVSFLVVPKGTELSNGLNPALIGYIGAIKVNSQNFTHSFGLPKWYCGEADIYIAGLGMDNGVNASVHIPENKYMYVASIDVDKSSMIASVIFNNFTTEEKNATVIVAGYKDDKLVDVRTEVINAPAKTYLPTEIKTLGFTLSEPVDEVKAYVWSNLSEIEPLIGSVTK